MKTGGALLVAVVMTVLCACAGKPSQVTAVDNVYVNRLNARLAQYNQTASELDGLLKNRFESPLQEASTTDADQARTVEEISRDIMRTAEVHARAAMLTRFMREAAVSGQLGLMTSWLQNQIAELTRYTKDTDASATALQRDGAANPNDPQLGMRVYTLLNERGAEQGAAEELFAISNDVQGYGRD